MSNMTDVNRALAYKYLARAAMIPLAIIVLVLVAGLAALSWAASSISGWWLVFLLPYMALMLIAVVAIGAGAALLNALKPRKLTSAEKQHINEFIDYANEKLGDANSLRGGPFGVIFGILQRKYRQNISLSEAVVAPLINAPKLRKRYEQLINSFGRVTVQNESDQ